MKQNHRDQMICFFTSGRRNNADKQDPNYMYDVLDKEFAAVLDRIGLEARDSESKKHEVTLHSFRRYVYSTIEKLGNIEFANCMIGHANSTYWRVTQGERLETFKKFEPYLTYLSYEELEAQGTDAKSEIESLKEQLKSQGEQLEMITKSMNSFLKSEEKIGKQLPAEIIAHVLNSSFEGRDPKRPLSEWRKEREALDRKYGITEKTAKEE